MDAGKIVVIGPSRQGIDIGREKLGQMQALGSGEGGEGGAGRWIGGGWRQGEGDGGEGGIGGVGYKHMTTGLRMGTLAAVSCSLVPCYSNCRWFRCIAVYHGLRSQAGLRGRKAGGQWSKTPNNFTFGLSIIAGKNTERWLKELWAEHKVGLPVARFGAERGR